MSGTAVLLALSLTVTSTRIDSDLIRAITLAEEAEIRLSEKEGENARLERILLARPVVSVPVTPGWVPWVVAGSVLAGIVAGTMATLAVMEKTEKIGE